MVAHSTEIIADVLQRWYGQLCSTQMIRFACTNHSDGKEEEQLDSCHAEQGTPRRCYKLSLWIVIWERTEPQEFEKHIAHGFVLASSLRDCIYDFVLFFLQTEISCWMPMLSAWWMMAVALDERLPLSVICLFSHHGALKIRFLSNKKRRWINELSLSLLATPTSESFYRKLNPSISNGSLWLLLHTAHRSPC